MIDWIRTTQTYDDGPDGRHLCCAQAGNYGAYTLAEWPMGEEKPRRVHIHSTPNPLEVPALLAGYDVTLGQNAALMGIFVELSSWLWETKQMDTEKEAECRFVFIDAITLPGELEPYDAAWKAP